MPLLNDHYTSEDYWNLPEEERAELINGKFYDMAPPSRIHQKLVSKLTALFNQYIADHHGSCEIVPPASRKMDYSLKNMIYSQAGVREYWIVDPAKEKVVVYCYENDSDPCLYSFDADVPVGIYPGLTIRIRDLLK